MEKKSNKLFRRGEEEKIRDPLCKCLDWKSRTLSNFTMKINNNYIKLIMKNARQINQLK